MSDAQTPVIESPSQPPTATEPQQPPHWKSLLLRLRGWGIGLAVLAGLTVGANLLQGSPDLKVEDENGVYQGTTLTMTGFIHNTGRADANDTVLNVTVVDNAGAKLGEGQAKLGTVKPGDRPSYR